MNNGICLLCNKSITSDKISDHLITEHHTHYKINNQPDELKDMSKCNYVLLVTREKIIEDDDFTVDKFTKFWLCVIIKGKKTFDDLNNVIINEWKCCNCNNGHCYNYKINNRTITNAKTKKTDKTLKSTRLYDELKLNSVINCELDDILTTNLKITVINIYENFDLEDIILCAKNFDPVYQCKICKKKNICTNMMFCTGCNKIFCTSCCVHNCENKRIQYITNLSNNPRSGIVCHDLSLYKIGRHATQLYEALEAYR